MRKATIAVVSNRLRSGRVLDRLPPLYTYQTNLRSLSTQSGGRNASVSTHKSVKPPTSSIQPAKSPSSFASLLSNVISNTTKLRQESQQQLQPIVSTTPPPLKNILMQSKPMKSPSSPFKSDLSQPNPARSHVLTSSSLKQPLQTSNK